MDHYTKVLGFDSARRIDETTAFVTGHGVTLQLRRAASGELDGGRRCAGSGPHALLLVDHPRGLRLKLSDLGTRPISGQDLGEEWAGCFGIPDCYGNVLGIGPTSGLKAEVTRRLADPLGDLGRRLHERRRAREEAAHLAEFRSFYESLPDKHNIFYMFFSRGLLHWVNKAMSYVPPETNLVLMGTDLPDEELGWLRRHVHRPFHHVRLRIDDQIAWDFLFNVNRHNFGWLDTDCLVLRPSLFAELADIAPETSLNCAWSWDSGYGFPLANTFFLFVNASVIAALRAQRLSTSPYAHDYEWQNLQVPGRRCYGRTPNRAQLERLSTIVPRDGAGRVATPRGMSYYDTMVMYQMLARACGHPVHRVRRLEGFGHIRGLDVQEESTDELIHIGGRSKADALDELSGYFHDTSVRVLYLIAESVALHGAADQLPEFYQERSHHVGEALARHGLTEDSARASIRSHLIEARGMSKRGVDALLRH